MYMKSCLGVNDEMDTSAMMGHTFPYSISVIDEKRRMFAQASGLGQIDISGLQRLIALSDESGRGASIF